MTDTVHVEIPHLSGHALFEGAVDWRACGAVAAEVAIAGLQERIPDAGLAQKTWQRMIATGHVTRDEKTHAVTGATIEHVKWALADRGYEQVDFIDYSDHPDLEGAIHPLLKAATAAGHPVIGIYTNGQALPDNERNVRGHFTTAFAIDSVKGYEIANGDTQTAIRNQAHYRQWPACSQVPTNWATWATLKAAGLSGVIAVRPNVAAPTSTPAPATVAVSASEAAQVAALAQQLSSLAAQLTDVVKAL